MITLCITSSFCNTRCYHPQFPTSKYMTHNFKISKYGRGKAHKAQTRKYSKTTPPELILATYKTHPTPPTHQNKQTITRNESISQIICCLSDALDFKGLLKLNLNLPFLLFFLGYFLIGAVRIHHKSYHI
jgi:hypothetical protein